MSKQQTFDIQVLADLSQIESEFAEQMKRNVRKFDEYEEEHKEQVEYGRCVHCGDKECDLHPLDDLTWNDEHRGFLCTPCLVEEEGKRIIIENEKKLHHKGSL